MTAEEYLEVKEDYFNNIKKILVESGSIPPTVTVIGNQKEDDKPAIIHIPLTSDIANSDEMKQRFVDKMIPEISKKVNEKFDISAVGFASEAWMRIADKDEFDPKVDNYKDIPVNKEILIITIENQDGVQCSIFEIKRDGKSINPDGDLVDTIELENLPDLEQTYAQTEGRFSNLYKKFTKQ